MEKMADSSIAGSVGARGSHEHEGRIPIADMSYVDLLNRKEDVLSRLGEVAVKDLPPANRRKGGAARTTGSVLNNPKRSSSNTRKAAASGATLDGQIDLVPSVPKADYHWDFVLKEMMWLGTDFQAERKRQVSLAKKLAAGIRQYHKTKESRRLRELAEAELKRRRLAGRISRELRGWWTKIERVVAYKQKLSADEERKKAMNKQLVALVKQTERYSESLMRQQGEYDNDDHDDDDVVDEIDDDDGQHQHKTEQQQMKKLNLRNHPRLTIEEALASEHTSVRKMKGRVTDYSRLRLKKGDDELYGESTASDSGSDASYTPESDIDDETTLAEAEHDEIQERRRLHAQHDQDIAFNDTFIADPDELRKLHEEGDMDIDRVIERLMSEANNSIESDAEKVGDASRESMVSSPKAKRVKFDPSCDPKTDEVNKNDATETAGISETQLREPREQRLATHSADTGSDADDDGDASDVEDFVEAMGDTGDSDDGSEEFEADETEVDDETTMMEEERLPKEMSAEEEINLLKKESEMSIEELRSLYSNIDAGKTHKGHDESHQPGNEESEVDPSNPIGVTKIETRHQVNASSTDAADKSKGSPPSSDPAKGSSLQDLLADPGPPQSSKESSNGPNGTDENGIEDDDDEEFQPSTMADVDDETTIAAEEKLGRDMSYEDEMALLKRESEMSLDELRAMYAAMDSGSEPPSEVEEDSDESSGDRKVGTLAEMWASASQPEADEDDYQPEEADAVDDETTIAAEERLGRDMSYAEELELLKRENEMSVDELRAKYQNYDHRSVATQGGSENEGLSILNSTLKDEEMDGDEEFEPEEIATDDETTIAAEEKLGREMSVEDEIAALKKDCEIPVESLLELYNKMEEGGGTSSSEDESTERKRKHQDVDPRVVKKVRHDPDEAASDDGLAALNALEASAERARKTLASRPYLLANWVKLREYQQIGLNWLVSLQSRRLNGILADEMGLGKTLQTITLLSYLSCYKGIWGPHLVVVPTSVIINWETELKRFCPALKVLCYYGSAKRRKELRTGWTKSNWYHVVVTSYQLVVQDAFAFKRKRWYYLILDEAQNIKNFQSQRWQTLINFNTQRRLLLTGTPLQNNLMELWSLLHFLMPYIFRSRKEFSYWFSNPMNSMIEGNSDRNEEVIKRLHGIIRPFVLRRLKKDVETQMPGKFEHIVRCQLSRRQMTIYEEFLARSSTRQALQKGGNFMGMMNVLMQLRKVCNHPDLFEPRSVITPFVLPGVNYTVPKCICEARPEILESDHLSEHLLAPLWCGSSGLPSFDATLRHDLVESSQLRRLEGCDDTESLCVDTIDDGVPTELKTLIREIRENRRNEKVMNVRFRNKINIQRCRSPAFAYPSTLLRLLMVRDDPLDRDEPVQLIGKDIVLTPSQLLEMRRTRDQRARDLDDTIDKFVFCVPKAGSLHPSLNGRTDGIGKPTTLGKPLEAMLLEPLNDLMLPFRKVEARLSSFFPDKRLIQFDAGKLQTLAELLRTLKRGGHRALIFTQMSKMLDILEAFLNINGHTYLRLDGSTGVDRRQRYMDRFNNDTKIFCFILSTRSGGMGINLTGADTVIFYDSDWNPAMDSQAQDRAHRIGQTRPVHIYRLITEHTIEENILTKAKQKKNLDIMVMDQGKFDASQINNGEEAKSGGDQVQDVFTKGGLRAILGVVDSEPEKESLGSHGSDEGDSKDVSNLSKEQMEMAMASLEDDDDVKALRGAQKEAAEELKEFDENAEIKKDSDAEEDEGGTKNESGSRPAKKQKTATDDASTQKEESEAAKKEEDELEKEFAAWQSKVGLNAAAISASLSPLECYGLNFREAIDPFYSIFAINEYRRKMEATEIDDTIDIDEIERDKAKEERLAMEEGDLLATNPKPEDLVRQRNFYRRERMRRRGEKRRRTLTGENWSSKIDGTTKNPFWYNSDTGEAIWDKPLVLIELEAEERARREGWVALPLKPLFNVMSFLIPFPERTQCSMVCRQWRAAANDIKFVRHVYPVEMGAIARVQDRREYNHYGDIAEALATALPGDTIELADGHYWVSEPGLTFDVPIKLVGDENNAANVVIEMSGSVVWRAKGGWIEGVTFRRPKITSGDPPAYNMLSIVDSGRIDIVHSVFDNEGSTGNVISISGTGKKGRWQNVSVRGGGGGGVTVNGGCEIELCKCIISKNRGHGVQCMNKGICKLVETKVYSNLGFGIFIKSSSAVLTKCRFADNEGGTMKKESGCTTSCTSNISIVPSIPPKTIPGFRLLTREQEENMDKEVPSTS